MEASVQLADTTATEKTEIQEAQKDLQEARKREATVTEKGTWFQKNVGPILAIIAVVATMTLFYLMIYQKPDEQSRDITLYILGVLSTIVSQIFAYYFGSSLGSRIKQDQLFKQSNGK